MPVETNVSLKSLNSWHIGGNAEYYLAPESLAELQMVLQQNNYSQITYLGLGSNVLISDAGIKGLVVHLHKMPGALKMLPDNSIMVSASLPCAKLAKFAAKYGAVEAAFLAGIPGTIGGALAMNAGAWGQETWNRVQSVTVIDSKGNIQELPTTAYDISYRKVGLKNKQSSWFLSAIFKYNLHDKAQAEAEIKKLLAERKLKQPIGEFSCGSVFKNPHPYFAGQLIEQVGLKGFRIGGAGFSTKHANFIINYANASALDVMQLVQLAQEKVLAQYNVWLEPEFKQLGV